MQVLNENVTRPVSNNETLRQFGPMRKGKISRLSEKCSQFPDIALIFLITVSTSIRRYFSGRAIVQEV